MMSEPTIQSTISMWGSGDYSLHTKGAKDVIDNASDLVLSALEDMDVDPNDERPLQLADFAAADGGTSIDLMRAMVGKLRGRAPTRPIRVCYTDLPSNDYSALFQLVHGLKPAVKSYMQEFDGVYPFASATSFFERIFPDQQLDFGFSATAMHWLSEMPCDVSDHIHSVGASGRERELIRQRAAHDWEDILACRAKELRSGGRMVMVNLAVDDAGQHMGNTGGVNMFDTMNMLWRRLVDAGRITEAEYATVVIPQFYRSLEEFRAPLEDPTSRAYQAGLRLESAEIRYVRCPYAAHFERQGDVDAFASSYVPTTRTWSEAAFANSLDSKRSAEERAAIVGEFFDSFVEHVRSDPAGHGMDYVHAYISVRKI